jgi:hypothetical protein
MNSNPEYPVPPWMRLPQEEERNVIRRIRSKWNAPLVNYFGPRESRPASIWSRFRLDHRCYDRSVLERISYPPNEVLFLYIEDPYPGHVYVAKLQEIVRYLLDIPEYGYFRPAHYIVPQTLDWLVAHTDEEIRSGHLVLLDGDVPLMRDE